jgi:hypothetical protein
VRSLAVRAPLRTGHHHVNLAAAALGADQPLMPIENCGLGAASLRMFGGIRLDLMAAIPVPHDEANLGTGGIAERRALAALPSVIGGPGSDFTASGPPVALLAAVARGGS